MYMCRQFSVFLLFDINDFKQLYMLYLLFQYSYEWKCYKNFSKNTITEFYFCVICYTIDIMNNSKV